MKLSITEAGLEDLLGKRFPTGPRRAACIHRVLGQGRFIVQRAQQRRANVKTGNMRRSATSDYDPSTMTAHVRFMAGYSGYVDQGTSAHDIYPRLAQALRFVPGGAANPSARLTGAARVGSESAYVFSGGVHHPGYAGSQFMAHGLDDSLPDLKHLMESSLGTLVRGGE